MTEMEIRNQIWYFERQINENVQFINEQKDKLFDLQMLNSKLTSLETEFIERQQSRKNLLNGLSGKVNTIKIAKRYSEGMSILLSGWEYMTALSNFESSKNSTNKAISSCNEKIEQARNEINRYQSQIYSLQRQWADLNAQ